MNCVRASESVIPSGGALARFFCLQCPRMDIRRVAEQIRAYWREKAKAYWQDFRRLDGASRMTAVGVTFLGALGGLAPLAAMIVLFRLVDAVTGARAVRVMTSDLHHGLLTLLGVWVLTMVVWVLTRWLQGLTRRIADRTAGLTFMVSVLVASFALAPFRTLLIVAAHAALHPFITQRKVVAACVAVHALMAYSITMTVTTYLLARAISVGSYILFLGAIFGALTMTIVHATRRDDV